MSIKRYTIKMLMKEALPKEKQISDSAVYILKFHLESEIRQITMKATERLNSSGNIRKRLNDTDIRNAIQERDKNV